MLQHFKDLFCNLHKKTLDGLRNNNFLVVLVLFLNFAKIESIRLTKEEKPHYQSFY